MEFFSLKYSVLSIANEGIEGRVGLLGCKALKVAPAVGDFIGGTNTGPGIKAGASSLYIISSYFF
jgi:hypothetical protein